MERNLRFGRQRRPSVDTRKAASWPKGQAREVPTAVADVSEDASRRQLPDALALCRTNSDYWESSDLIWDRGSPAGDVLGAHGEIIVRRSFTLFGQFGACPGCGFLDEGEA